MEDYLVKFSLDSEGEYGKENEFLLNSLDRPRHVFACTCSRCKRYFQERLKLPNILKCNDANIYVVRHLVEAQGFRLTSLKSLCQLNLIWLNSMPGIKVFTSLRKYQKINHFPYSFLISKKDELYRNYTKMRELFGEKHFNFIPQTYILPQDREEFIKDFYLSKDGCPLFKDSLWIMKPCNKACGRGIRIFPRLHSIDISKKTFESNVVISRYIDNPLLIQGKKFDIRVYVLVTSVEPLKIYIYNDCLFRIASEGFSTNKELISNQFVHLTNTFVQKQHRRYRSNESLPSEGINVEELPNKLSLFQFQSYLKEKGLEDEINLSEIFVDIEDISIKTILSMETKVRATLNKLYKKGLSRNNCFQLFGFDYLVSREDVDRTKVWLVEVNGSPSLGVSSKLDKTIKLDMVCEVLNIVGIHDIDLEKVDIERHLGIVPRKHCRSVKTERPKFVHDCDVNSESAREHDFRKKALLKQRLKQNILHEQKRSSNWKLIFPSVQSEKYHNFFETPSSVQQLVFEIYRNPNMRDR